MQVMIECKHDKPEKEIEDFLVKNGVILVPGMIPVPMDGGSIIFVAEVYEPKLIKSLPGVIEVFSDPEIDPMLSPRKIDVLKTLKEKTWKPEDLNYGI